jgi:hypothetical protein
MVWSFQVESEVVEGGGPIMIRRRSSAKSLENPDPKPTAERTGLTKGTQ